VNLLVKLANFAVEIEKNNFITKYPDLKKDKSMEGLLKLFLPFGIAIQDLFRLKIAIVIPHDESNLISIYRETFSKIKFVSFS